MQGLERGNSTRGVGSTTSPRAEGPSRQAEPDLRRAGALSQICPRLWSSSLLHRTALVLPALLFSGALGCQQKMAVQPSYQPNDPCAFFADGKASRPPPAGTVARGHLSIDAALFTGRKSLEEPTTAPRQTREEQADRGGAKAVLAGEAAQFEGVVDEFPFPITREILEHGRDRFMIYCVVCHDAAGTGFGKIVERGYTRPPSYHIDRLRQAPVGHIFRVISQGYGSMPSYAAQIPTRDRWAIVAYVRALQLSQHFPVEKLPDDMRKEWNESQKRDFGRRGPDDRAIRFSFPGSAWERTEAEALSRLVSNTESVVQRSPGLADPVGQPWAALQNSYGLGHRQPARFSDRLAAERRHRLARNVSPWKTGAANASPGGATYRGGQVRDFWCSARNSSNRKPDVFSMSSLQGSANSRRWTSGLRHWLNYAAAPRLRFPQVRSRTMEAAPR